MSIACCLAAGAIQATAGMPPGVSFAAPPPWSSPPPAVAESSGETSRLRHLDLQIHLPASGSTEIFSDRQTFLASPEDVDVWGSWELEFQPNYQRLSLHRLEVLRDGRWSDRLRTSRLTVVQREDDLRRQVLDQMHTLIVLVDDLRPGDTLRFSYTLGGTNPVFGRRFFRTLSLRSNLPIDEYRVSLEAAPGRAVRWRQRGGGEEPKEGRSRQIRWRAQDLPAVDDWWRTDSEGAVLEISEFESWGDVVAWALPLFEPGPAPAELVAVAAAIRDKHEPQAARLLAARNWVQDELRYFALSLDEHSHAPYDTAEILRRRYGDCKDKVVLLSGLLAQLGIPAWAVLVDSDGGGEIGDLLPSPGAFDHAIVGAEIDGRRVWIDPTLTQQGGRRLDDIHLPAFGQGLEIRPDAADLVPLPEEPAGPIEVTYRYAIEHGDPRSTVTIDTVYARGSAENLRRRLTGTSPAELLADYLDFYGSDEHQVTSLGDLAVKDDRSANRMTIRERYAVTHRESEGEGLYFTTLPLLIQTHLSYPEGDDEVRLPHPLDIEERVLLEAALPGELGEISESIENRWFRYRAQSQRTDSGFEIAYALETLAESVPPEGLDTYRKDLDRFYDSVGYQLWNGAADSDLDWQEKDTLFMLLFGAACLLAGLATAVAVAVFWLRERRRSADS